MKKRSTKRLQKKRLFIYSVTVFIGFIMLCLAALSIATLANNRAIVHRQDRINAIYASLKLDESYRVAASDIFGDRRVYEWDSGRTYASSVEYGRKASRSQTFADLKTHIEKAGFKKIEGPNYGSAVHQDHYKSERGEYIRVSINTAAVQSSFVYGTKMPKAFTQEQIETGPVYITIKVNLDDNNE